MVRNTRNSIKLRKKTGMKKSRYSCFYPFKEKELLNAKKYFLIKARNVIKILDIQNEQELIKSPFSKYFPLGPT